MSSKGMKGRPITSDEFERLKASTLKIVGDHAAPSWLFLLDGLWESGFRLSEIMNFSWDDRSVIHPIWTEGQYPVIVIPGNAQKNGVDETIPMLPGLDDLLQRVPKHDRNGWVFHPLGIQDSKDREQKPSRPQVDWVGKIISKIGCKADILVRGNEASKRIYLEWRVRRAGDRKTGPYLGDMVKFASAHDLRRSLGDRLRNEGVPPLIITRVLRHSSWEVTSRFYAPGKTQNEAEELYKRLKK